MTAPTLAARHLSLAYDDTLIVDDLTIDIPVGKVTVIVGANACGKSTLLRGLCRLLKPRAGTVLLDGHDIHSLPTREVATKLGVLPQQPVAPEGITVADLVGRGRHPHQRWFRQWSPDDERIVDAALDATGVAELADRPMDELSGGQKQRAWIALALAQGTDLMLLDEPTTFLDLAHQVEVLDLLAELNEHEGRTIVLVLHDLNLACRYAHHLVAMKAGSIAAEGLPADVITAELVADVFGLEARIIEDPLSGTPLVVPVPAAQRRRPNAPRSEAAAVRAEDEAEAEAAGRTGSAPVDRPSGPTSDLPPPPAPHAPAEPAADAEPTAGEGADADASTGSEPDRASDGEADRDPAEDSEEAAPGWHPPTWTPPGDWAPSTADPSSWSSATPGPGSGDGSSA